MHMTTLQPSKTYPVHRRIPTLTLACAVLAINGCAFLAPSTPEQIVQKRAVDYWNARMAGQLDKAYVLSTPSYRKLRTKTQFNRQFGAGASFESAEVNKVECEPDKCNVQMKLGVKPAILGVNLGTVPIFVNETWVLEEGNWWRYQDV